MGIFDKKYHIRLDEKQIIKLLIHWSDSNGEPDLRPFVNMIPLPEDIGDKKPYTGCYIKVNTLRTDLLFTKPSKPGDFDVILIPIRNEHVFFNRAAVYEIKVVRPTRAKPSKNSNSFGITQVNGLINDGFPFVGLIHICMPEPLKDREKMRILVGGELNYENNGSYWESIDQFGNYSCDKQIQRMLSFSIPKFVGIAAYSLELYDKGLFIGSCSQSYWNYQKGYFNPKTKKETVDKLADFFISNERSFIKRTL